MRPAFYGGHKVDVSLMWFGRRAVTGTLIHMPRNTHSTAGSHGSSALWQSSDGSFLSRESILLRGMVWEQDEAIHFGPNGQPDHVTIRGITPTGDAAETFIVNDREARWKTPVDSSEKAYDNRGHYLPYGAELKAGRRKHGTAQRRDCRGL